MPRLSDSIALSADFVHQLSGGNQSPHLTQTRRLILRLLSVQHQRKIAASFFKQTQELPAPAIAA
jgi:hypothetical protein